VVHERDEQVRVELEVARELAQQLVHAVAPLKEDARTLIVGVVLVLVTSATSKLVTE